MDLLVVASLFLLLFLGVADNQVIAALLPSLVRSFEISVGTAGLLVTFYAVAAAVAAFLAGSLSDHYGRRRFLLGGVLVFAFASWLAFRSETFSQLLAARALTGLGAGTISTCAIAYAGDWFDYSIRGRAIGLVSSAYFAAPILGVPAAAQLADRFGWRTAFLGFALLAVLASLATLTLPKPSTEHESSEYGFAVTARAFRGFLARRDTVAALVIAFLVSAGLVGFLTYIGEWLHAQFGVATRTIGWVFMLGGLVAIVGAPLGGWLSDHYGKRGVSIASNALMAAGLLLLPFVPWGGGLLVLFGFIALAAAFRQGPLTALMTELVPGRRRGAFIALRNISSQMGIGLVVLAGGLLYQRHGYFAVTALAAAMTALVALLLATHIAEPQAAREGER